MKLTSIIIIVVFFIIFYLVDKVIENYFGNKHK